MKLRKMCKNRLAFTLVELVVVIAILAILSGAVAGAVVGVRASANKSEVTDTAAELATQLQLLWGGGAVVDGSEVLISKSTKNTNIKTWLEKLLPGVTYETTQTAAASRTAGTKYILIPASTNYTTGSLVFKVYTNKYTMDVTVDAANGSVSKGSVTAV